MTNKPFGSPSDAIKDATSTIREVVSHVKDETAELGQKASEFGRTAVGALDARRDTAASGLDSAAATLHANAEKLGKFAHQAADTLGDTADYVRDNTMRDVVTDLKGYVKAHPTQALIGAVVVGFLAGRLLTRE